MGALSTRRAKPEDAEPGAVVLRRSITELCTLDHRNDPATLDAWLENKTPEHFAGWVTDEANCVVVVEIDASIVGVGLLRRSGEIGLCYVEPGRERRGVGRAIVHALEDRARLWGVARLRLQSSVNARSFYERCGYVAAGESTCGFGISRCYPYEKIIRSAEESRHGEGID
jgi:GNAT superfamily N-acetyltransferase